MRTSLTSFLVLLALAGCEVESHPSAWSGSGGGGGGSATRSAGSRATAGGGSGGGAALDPALVARFEAAIAKADAQTKELAKAREEMKATREAVTALVKSLSEKGEAGAKSLLKGLVQEVDDAAKGVQSATGAFDHQPFDDLLARYVKGGKVDYKTWKAKDLKALEAYLDKARAQDPAALPDDDHRMAFWINVYNAWTIRSILDVYPTKSILDHAEGKPDALRGGVWKKNEITINGEAVSLNHIENGILRPMGDARIHFAVNCASDGCPVLQPRAFFPSRLNEQLQAASMEFFSTPSKFKVDAASKTVYLSQIFDWYKQDFGTEPQKVLETCAQWVKDEATAALMRSGEASIEYLEYGWDLNGVN